MDLHVGRSWTGHRIEDECPCPQEPCGLVSMNNATECDQHGIWACKTIRQGHPAKDCPCHD